jgi:hypothetical protein
MDNPFSQPPGDLIDLARYRLDDPAKRAELVAEARKTLEATSCVVLPGFVGGDAAGRMAAEAMRLRPRAWRRDDAMTPYGPPVAGLPPGDPRAIATPLAMQTLAGDDFEAASDIVRLYRWDGLTRFVAEVMGEAHHWHFDSNDFVISLLLQGAEAGGDFEFAPYIRSAEDENYGGVADVLKGGRDRVKTVRVEPGTLMMFCGKYSVHRVSPVRGRQPRVIALFSYDKRPDKMFSDASAARVFGRKRVTAAPALVAE